MTQEDKELLLKDLCARLLYHPRINVCNDSWEGCQTGEFDTNLYSYHIDAFVCDRIEVKPYLRPMSSMTEEEKGEASKLGICDDWAFHNDIYDVGIGMEEAFAAISWLLERHFDINYLIHKGLALEAPEGMYKTE